MDFFLYLAIMTLSTYLIRALPLTLLGKKITNPFLRSFLYYIPYTILTALTIPAGFFATGNLVSAVSGLSCAALLARKTGSLILVAGAACAVAWLVDTVMTFL